MAFISPSSSFIYKYYHTNLHRLRLVSSSNIVMASGPNESVVSLLDRLTNIEEALYLGTHESAASLLPPQAPHHPYPPHRQLANPSPLGLFGFALVSILSGVLKISTDSSAVSDGLFSAVAIFLGGGAQIIAALFQFLLNNSHSATTFALFGFHWTSQGVLLFIRAISDLQFESPPRPVAQVTYYVVLTLATSILWIPTLRMNYVLSVTLMFVIGVFAMDVPAVYGVRAAEIISGVFAIVASTLALYMAVLDLVNEAWKKNLLPLFPHKDHAGDYQQKVVPYVPKRTYHKSAVSAAHL